jgi:hypothetical protein
LLDRHGYRVCKSRQWKHVPNLDNYGDYMLIATDSNFAVLGFRFDATLDAGNPHVRICAGGAR